MQNAVMGRGLLIAVERMRPSEPKRRLRRNVYNDSIKKALILKDPFFTISISIKPAADVTRFSNKILINTTAVLVKKTSFRVTGRVRRYSAVLLYSSLRKILEERDIEYILPSTIM